MDNLLDDRKMCGDKAISKTDTCVEKSSKSEAPYKLEQQVIYTTMSASESKEETKVIPPDCFF
jgi:hypothetical protein